MKIFHKIVYLIISIGVLILIITGRTIDAILCLLLGISILLQETNSYLEDLIHIDELNNKFLDSIEDEVRNAI